MDNKNIAPVAAQAVDATCTCPSGDGSLRWPCPAHPPAHADDDEDENVEADAYMHACDLMEQFQRERAKRGVEIGTQGSLCDGIAWLFDRIKKLETAAPSAAPVKADAANAGDELGEVVSVSEFNGIVSIGLIGKAPKLGARIYATGAADVKGAERLGIARNVIKELSSISMHLAADLVQGATYTFQGHDYLDRNFVCERVVQWRVEWDATAERRAAIAASQKGENN